MKSNNNPISIIIQLDTQLNLRAGSFVNDGQGSFFDTIEYKRDIDLSSRSIRLYTIFQSVWEEMMSSIDQSNVTSILFLIGPNAGFTDSRMVYIWLRSHTMVFPDTTLGVLKHKPIDKIDLITGKKVSELASIASPELQYSQEPRIG
jgi:hypothetical protein